MVLVCDTSVAIFLNFENMFRIRLIFFPDNFHMLFAKCTFRIELFRAINPDLLNLVNFVPFGTC